MDTIEDANVITTREKLSQSGIRQEVYDFLSGRAADNNLLTVVAADMETMHFDDHSDSHTDHC